MKVKFILTVLFTALVGNVVAQYNTNQNKFWAFGYHAGVDWSSGTPVSVTTTINTSEGSSAVCNAAGSVLFYTDGRTVYKSTGAVMTSGAALTTYSTSSTSQGSVIIPVIGNPNQYWLFSLEAYFSGTAYCRLFSSIVDMSLSGGTGDVIASSAGTLMASYMAEKMIAVQGNACNVWLIVHHKDSAQFRAYNVTSAGISAPVISNVGSMAGTNSYTVGVMKVTPDRSKIVSQQYYISGGQGTELYDFDANTGTVSNCRVLNSTTTNYGAEFSPDNSKLYVQEVGSSAGIYQYDISLSTTAAIIASKTLVVSSSQYTDLKLAPDSKIYLQSITSFSSGFLDCIPNPNVAGSGCGFTSHAITLTPNYGIFGLPSLYWGVGASDTEYVRNDTVACIPTGGTITLSAHGTGAEYRWSTGDSTSTTVISSYGTYVVSIASGCTITYDTISVTPPPPSNVIVRRDSSVCESVGSMTLTSGAVYPHYYWYDGTTSPSNVVNATGTYWVRAYDDCGNERNDTFKITFIPIDSTYFVFNLSLCNGDQGLVLNASPGLDAYIWQDGTTTGTTYNAVSGGTFYVIGTSFCKVNIDSFYVSPKNLSFTLGNDTVICVAYELKSPLIDSSYTYRWQDGYTGPTNFINQSGNYILTINYGSCTASDTINVQFDRIAQNIPDTFICKGQPINVVVNATLYPNGSVLWNDGSTNPTKVLRDSGIYWVFVSKKECMILDTIRVNTGYCNCWHNVPSAFTPNNDGQNDIIKPKIEPGCPISGYQFIIYNRWGQEVFKSDFRDKGWDGMYNGQPADLGVYMYSLQFYKGVSDMPVIITGDITLIR